MVCSFCVPCSRVCLGFSLCTETSDSLLNTVSISGRLQNHFDKDGSVSSGNLAGLPQRPRGPTIMGSAFAQDWWLLDNYCEESPDSHADHGVLLLCSAATPNSSYTALDTTSSVVAAGLFEPSPSRSVSSFVMEWNPDLSVCSRTDLYLQ